MNFSYYKYCTVPQCNSTTIKTPNKLFIYVPNNREIRKKWLKLAKKDDAISFSTGSRMYFCEDHFDLPNDMINYMEYHIKGTVSQVRMKPVCMPSKFGCQKDRKKRKSSSNERSYMLKKLRKMLIAECLNESNESCTPSSSLDTSDTSSSTMSAKRKTDFSARERYLLVEILEDYKDKIENKKTDSASLKKSIWEVIAQRFNNSAIVSDTATGEQLRLLWQNLKTCQREELTKESQYHLATGGGGPCPDANLDPAINEVAPALIVEIPNALDSDTNELILQEIEIHQSVSEGMTQNIIVYEDPLPSTSQQSAPLLPTTPLPVITQPLPLPLEQHLSPLQSTTPVPVPQPTPRISADVDYELSDLSDNEKQLRVQILKMEYYNRKKRADEIHTLQLKKNELEFKILEQQLREAQAKADLAEKNK